MANLWPVKTKNELILQYIAHVLNDENKYMPIFAGIMDQIKENYE